MTTTAPPQLPGSPTWTDLVTSDPAGARAFYGALFGWEFDIGPPETGLYTYCLCEGRRAAGMVGRPVENMPTGWTTYLATPDADESARLMVEAGASVVLPPVDAGPAGRVAVVTDSSGATVGVWQGREHPGAEITDRPGAVAWTEMVTGDVESAVAFYSRLFPYTWDDEPPTPGGGSGVVFRLGGRPVGAIRHVDGPSRWLPLFAVTDVDEGAATAQRLGGAIEEGPADSSRGRSAQLVDPQGGVFGVVAHAGSSHPTS